MKTDPAAAKQSAHEARLPASLLGMVLFISSEVMFFGALFGAYYTLRSRAGQWPPPGTPDIDLVRPAILTAVLVASSWSQHLAVGALRRGDGRALVRWLSGTVVLGALFLAGEGWEWTEHLNDGFSVATNVFGTLFFTMTGFHGLHLAGGLVILLLALKKATSSSYEHQRLGSIEAATYYWHFVDAVWLFLFVTIYVLPA